MRTRALPILAVLAVLLPACATDKYGPPRTTWDDAPSDSNDASGPAPSAAPAAAAPKRTASTVAAEASSASSCVAAAKRHPGEAAVAILGECMRRRDFYDLAAVLQEPWLPQVRSSAKLQARLVEVVARRGGFLEGDLAEIAKAGVPLYSLAKAMEKPDAMRGALVVVRGTVEGVRSEKLGNRTALVATINETSWLEEGVSEGSPSISDIERSAVERTGRQIFVRVDKREQLRRAADVVVLMAFETPRKTTNEDGEEEDSAVGKLAASFDPAATLQR